MKWYILTGPDQFQNTDRLKALHALLLHVGIDALWLSDATKKGLERLADETVVIVTNYIDLNAAFRRRLIRALGDTDITVIAAAQTIPSDIAEYESLDGE